MQQYAGLLWHLQVGQGGPSSLRTPSSGRTLAVPPAQAPGSGRQVTTPLSFAAAIASALPATVCPQEERPVIMIDPHNGQSGGEALTNFGEQNSLATAPLSFAAAIASALPAALCPQEERSVIMIDPHDSQSGGKALTNVGEQNRWQ
jgi:hypothetical protein